ncbi:hypothetical protein KFE25_000754 [Diacronema lutheri]|uniref:tRNA-uridine aminocarboxypropyltransferase n=2 Tax=Diacronema lutheri TaxID=2081491 RepID=A0A8J6CH72_DIALT|nr:hypothetical protein KFE25_000754 [Diacronema lutheri]
MLTARGRRPPSPACSPFVPAPEVSDYVTTIDAILRIALAAAADRDAVDIKSVPQHERNELLVKLTVGLRIAPAFERARCRYCFHSRCICSLMARPRALRHRIWVWIHNADLFRASNSGKLVASTCPSARLAVAGIPSTEAALLQLLAQKRPTTCVLFPAKHARTTAEYVQWLASGAQNGPCDETQCEAAPRRAMLPPAADCRAGGAMSTCARAQSGVLPPPLDIVVIDGTWTQVRGIVRRLPADLNFVRVNLGCTPSLFSARHQGLQREQLGFTSTLEACAALLDELGEPEAVSAALRESFMLNDDTVLLFKRGEQAQAYGSWLRRSDGVLVPLAVDVGGYVD